MAHFALPRRRRFCAAFAFMIELAREMPVYYSSAFVSAVSAASSGSSLMERGNYFINRRAVDKLDPQELAYCSWNRCRRCDATVAF